MVFHLKKTQKIQGILIYYILKIKTENTIFLTI